MVSELYLGVITICIVPVLVFFSLAGAISMYSSDKSTNIPREEEVEHEL